MTSPSISQTLDCQGDSLVGCAPFSCSGVTLALGPPQSRIKQGLVVDLLLSLGLDLSKQGIRGWLVSKADHSQNWAAPWAGEGAGLVSGPGPYQECQSWEAEHPAAALGLPKKPRCCFRIGTGSGASSPVSSSL